MIRTLFGLVVLLIGRFAVAQVPLPFDVPTLQLSYGGSVKAIIIASDGAVIIGGEFATVNGIARANIARIAPDGNVDLVWNPGADRGVYALAIDNQGALIVGGTFQNLGGATRYGLAKLQVDGQGSVDPTWNPGVDSFGALALDADASGSIYVGGLFDYVGGTFRYGLAKIASSTGAVDPTWNPVIAPSSVNIYAIKSDNLGSVFVGGYFTSLGGQTRQNVAKLSASGSGAADSSWNLGTDGPVNALALDGAGHLYVGGDFSKAGALYHGGLAKVSASETGVVDPTWNPAGMGEAFTNTLALDGHGALYVGGNLDTANVGHAHLVKLSTSGIGAVVSTWNADAGDSVQSLAVSAAGDVYVGGLFSTLGSQSRVGFGAVTKAGAILKPSNVGNGTPGRATAFARQPDGGIIVGGSFSIAGGAARYNLARLEPDGTLDPNWDPGRNSAWDNNPLIWALAANSDGDIFVSGGFTELGSQSRTHLAKVSGSGSGDADASWDAGQTYSSMISAMVPAADGSIVMAGVFAQSDQPPLNLVKLSNSSGQRDTTWNPAPNDGVSSLASSGDTLYAAGAFTAIGGQPHNHVARLSVSSGLTDSNWNPNVDEPVSFLALDASGALYLAGDFATIDGQARDHIGKLDADGSIDMNWSSSIMTVNCLAVGADDYLYVGGPSGAIDGQTRTGVARLSPSTGNVDPDWNPILGISFYGEPSVTALLVEPDDSLLVGGWFDSVDGRPRAGFARLQPDSIFRDGFEQPGI